MQSLSTQSIAFLKRIKEFDPSEQADPTWKLHYTRLFCELYDIIRTAHDSLNGLDMGSWSISYDGQHDHNELSFCFSLSISDDEFLPKIKIYINPFGESTIEIPIIESERLQKKTDESLQQFYKSPAYKRYFAPFANKGAGIKAVIPMKQITSRHLEGYLLHLLRMMTPYLNALNAVKSGSIRAA